MQQLPRIFPVIINATLQQPPPSGEQPCIFESYVVEQLDYGPEEEYVEVRVHPHINEQQQQQQQQSEEAWIQNQPQNFS